MSKPRPTRIPSDGCTVPIDGDICRPHEGEWVELVAAETVGELRARVRFARLGAEIDAIRGEPDENSRFAELMDAHYGELVDYLADRVFSWNWTGLKGRLLPPPTDEEGRPVGLLKLHAAELYWLLNATGSESEEARKNG